MYYARMGAGFVCHTLNPRLTVAHLAAMVNEAEDRVLAVGAGLADVARELVLLCPCIEAIMLLDGASVRVACHCADRRTLAFETLLAEHGARDALGRFRREMRRRGFATRRARRARRKACSTRTAPTICTRCARCRPTRSR